MQRSDRSKTKNRVRAIRAKLTGDFHNKIGAKRTLREVRKSVARDPSRRFVAMQQSCRFRGKADIQRATPTTLNL
jgi:hypothetical protein